MNAVMMHRMQRLDRQDLLQGRVNLFVFLAGVAAIGIQRVAQPGLGFQVVGIAVGNGLIQRDLPLGFFLLVPLAVEFVVEGVDVHRLAFGGMAAKLLGVIKKFLRPLAVVGIGHRHAPVADGAIGIEHRRLAKGSLRLEVPKAVQLPDALLDELLDLFLHVQMRRCNLKFDSPRPLHEIGGLPRPFVECLAVGRMPGGQGGCGGWIALLFLADTGRVQEA